MPPSPSTAYWWTSRPNFGDELTPLLLTALADLTVEWAPPDQADLIAVGSIIDVLPGRYTGTILGSGILRPSTRRDVSAANVLAIRGPLTRDRLTGLRPGWVYGDLGLLANELVRPVKRHNLGIVPHWSDTELGARPDFARYDPLIVDVTADPLTVIAQIASCRKIVASSLHGAIVADAYAIPRRLELCPRFTREGGDFKFQDHNRTVGVPHLIGVTQEAPRHIVESRQHELFDLVQSLGSARATAHPAA